MDDMLTLTCLCGAVRIEAGRPAFVHACNCQLCRKSGARWGYYHPDAVRVDGVTSGYARGDKAEPAAELHSCATCGSTTHFVLTPAAIEKYGNAQMGVNMALADESELAGIQLRFPDGRNWEGSSEFGYVRPPRILGA